MGGCVCVEVYDPAVLKGYQEYAYKRGVFSRPFLNYLYAMVPYVIKEEELIQVLQSWKDWFASRHVRQCRQSCMSGKKFLLRFTKRALML